MFHDQRVVVVMPAYNAARTLERTVREIPMDLVDEIVVTDDASADDTVAEAQRLEFVLYTELGYEPGVWSEPRALERTEQGPFGAGLGVRRISLREVLLCAGTVALFQAAVQSEDLGARTAYLEVRAVDDAKGITHRVLAASAWIELRLEPGLARLMLP